MSWQSVTLDEISKSVDYGLTAPSTQQPVGPKFLRITDIQDGRVDWASVPYCQASAKLAAGNALLPGDIVFARTGATTGKSFLIDECPPGSVFASYLIRVRPSAKTEPSFLAHFFKSAGYWRQIESAARGAAQPGVNSTVLKSLKVPLPPLAEQRLIASILDQADALRRKRRETLVKCELLAEAIFSDQFSDPIRNEARHPVSPLAGLIDQHRPITYGILMPGPDIAGGVPYVRVVDIKGGRILVSQVRRTSPEIAKQYRRSTLKAGDLLISIRGHVGRMAFTPDALSGANITQDTARLAIVGANPIFVNHLLSHSSSKKWMSDRTRGIAVQGINLGDLKLFPVIQPPRAKQDDFAAKIVRLDQVGEIGATQLVQLDSLFASLQQRAFNGELTAKVAERELAEVG